VVKDDKEQRIVVTVSGNALAGKQLQGEVWDRGRKRQRQVRCTPATVEAGAAQVDLVCELDASVAEAARSSPRSSMST